MYNSLSEFHGASYIACFLGCDGKLHYKSGYTKVSVALFPGPLLKEESTKDEATPRPLQAEVKIQTKECIHSLKKTSSK